MLKIFLFYLFWKKNAQLKPSILSIKFHKLIVKLVQNFLENKSQFHILGRMDLHLHVLCLWNYLNLDQVNIDS